MYRLYRFLFVHYYKFNPNGVTRSSLWSTLKSFIADAAPDTADIIWKENIICKNEKGNGEP